MMQNFLGGILIEGFLHISILAFMNTPFLLLNLMGGALSVFFIFMFFYFLIEMRKENREDILKMLPAIFGVIVSFTFVFLTKD